MESVEEALAAVLPYVQATTMLLSDWPVKSVDVLFFHSRAPHDDDGLFELAGELYRASAVKRVAINGSDGEREPGGAAGAIWPGKGFYIQRLRELGVAGWRDPILTRPAFNTKDEDNAFLEIARAEGWRSVGVLTQPHQLLRAMLGLVKSMDEQGYGMRVYAVAPRGTPWWKEVYGPQSEKLLPRFDHIWEELRRIPIYQAKGDLATFAEFFQYLRWRDYEGTSGPRLGGAAA